MAKQVREIRVRDLITYFYLSLVAVILLITGFVFTLIFVRSLWIRLAAILVFLAALYFVTMRLTIGCVLMYKAYASLEVRGRCRFEPTCSTYMIMAIRKYGLFRGVVKGVKRYRRCKPPNGGVDYP